MRKILLITLTVAFVLSLSYLTDVTVPTAEAATYGDTTRFISEPVAGNGKYRKNAFLDFPEDITRDGSGNWYIADTYNNVIRKINNSNGIVTTVAGRGSYGDTDGAATSTAELALPKGVDVDGSGNIYIADTDNDKIKKVSGGQVSTIASGLSEPEGVMVSGSHLYIADTGSNSLKRMSVNGGNVTTVAGSLYGVKKMAATGNYIYLTCPGEHRIKRYDKTNHNVVTIAGSGQDKYQEGIGTGASFENIWGITVDGSYLYVTDGDGFSDRVRKVNLSNNQTSIFADDSQMRSINYPIAVRSDGTYIYVLNEGLSNVQRFRKSDANDNDFYAGKDRFGNQDGSFGEAVLGRPYDMVKSGNDIFLAENNQVKKINLATQNVSHIIGTAVDWYKEGQGTDARFSTISGITIDSGGNALYVTDRWNNRIRKVNLNNNTSNLLSGGGQTGCSGSCNGYREGSRNYARFNNPTGIAISPDNQYLFVADTANNRIRTVQISNGNTWLLAGSGAAGYADGSRNNAKFNRPFGLTIDSSGRYLYVADSYNHRIRRVDISTGDVSTLAGSGDIGYRDGVGTSAIFSYPEHVKMGADGNLYVSEVGGHKIRFIDPNSRSVRVVSGTSGDRGYTNGNKNDARFNNPKGLLPDTANNDLYIADTWNDTIRRISIPGTAPFADPAPGVSGVSPTDRYRVAGSPYDKKWLTVNGSNFNYSATVQFDDYNMVNTYVTSSSSITVELPFGQMPPGWYDVTVTNLDAQVGEKSNGFIVLNADGSLPPPEQDAAPSDYEFYPYDPSLRGGYYPSTGNVWGDEFDEIVTGTGDGMGPQVQVFDRWGNRISSFFAYADTLRSGVRVATGDLDGDGVDEIITAPGKSGRPQIRVFDGQGNPKLTMGFFALDGKFQGGCNIGAGDVDGDGKDEIIVAASKGGGPHVTVHRWDGSIVANFMAYDVNFRGGISVGAGDMDGDGDKEIITGPENGAPHVQMFGLTDNGVRRLNPGFMAFSESFRGGLSIAGGDTNNDGRDELIVSQRTQGQAWVKVYKAHDQSILKNFLAYQSTFLGGTNVAAGDVDGDGKDEVITIPGSDGGPQVRIFSIY